MKERLNPNVRLFLRYAKEIHCLNEYYEDFIKSMSSNKNKQNVLKRLLEYPHYEPENFIGQAWIFPIWINNEPKRIFWLNYYEKIKKLNANKIITEFLLYKHKSR